jgi:stage V sporulation protein SpoVS
VEAVCKATLAIGNARLFLEADSLDIRAMPEFVTVRKSDGDLNALRFHITSESI